MIIFPLKKEWYDKIAAGRKTIEYREVKPYWTKRFQNQIGPGFSGGGFIAACFGDAVRPVCYLQLGYNPETRMIAKIKKIEVVDGKNTDLAIDKPVYAIHLDNLALAD